VRCEQRVGEDAGRGKATAGLVTRFPMAVAWMVTYGRVAIDSAESIICSRCVDRSDIMQSVLRLSQWVAL
jgi:hypothetical protein